MGQYYKPTILAPNKKTVLAWVYSHDIKETYTCPDGTKVKLGSGLKLMEHSWLKNKFVNLFETLILNKPKIVVWAGDYAKKCEGLNTNVYTRCEDDTKLIPKRNLKMYETRFIVNHTLKQFVDKYSVPNQDGRKIHPLPLLTCEGNGNGGGDFFGNGTISLIGSWARHLISVQSKKPIGYNEIKFDLTDK